MDDSAPRATASSSAQHSVISADAVFDGAAVRNVEVSVRDNDTPGLYVTEVEPGSTTETAAPSPSRDDTFPGNYNGLDDEVLVMLAEAPELGDTIVAKLVLDAESEREVFLINVAGRPALCDQHRRRHHHLSRPLHRCKLGHPARVGIRARDDDRREDPDTAVISFQLDTDNTIDAYARLCLPEPSLRPGPARHRRHRQRGGRRRPPRERRRHPAHQRKPRQPEIENKTDTYSFAPHTAGPPPTWMWPSLPTA